MLEGKILVYGHQLRGTNLVTALVGHDDAPLLGAIARTCWRAARSQDDTEPKGALARARVSAADRMAARAELESDDAADAAAARADPDSADPDARPIPVWRELEDHAVFQVWMLHVEKELDVGAGDSPWKPLRAYARARSALRELDPKLGGDGPHTMDK